MIESLKDRLGAKVSTSPSVLDAHGRDENYPETMPPLAVVFAESARDVQDVLAWAREHNTPVIPFGAGTSLEGHLVPRAPVISLDLSRMNHIIKVYPEDFLVEVEPGVTRTALDAALRPTGLFFPVDPGADASLGGMAATNASGTTTVKYGGMRHNVAALEVVLANGEALQVGRHVRKTSSGYDLKDLFVGSAGTLGVITKLTLHLHPTPPYVHTLRVFFPSLTAAAEASYAIMASALPVARLELLDELSMHAINRHMNTDYPEQPALFLEFHSSTEESIDAESRTVEELVREAGAIDIDVARTQEERTAQWEARHRIFWATTHLFPNQKYTITDVAVPLSKMPALISTTQQLLKEMDLAGGIVGHVGDGNFHTLVVTPPDELARAHEFSALVVARALDLEGTASGEHGIGLSKQRFMAAEHGPALEWMRRLKALFDPQGLLNPDKSL